MNYKLTYSTSFNDKYDLVDGHDVITTTVNEYKTDSLNAIHKLVDDTLDIPIAELTIAEVKKDFNLNDSLEDERFATAILNYYNGRLALSRHVHDDINDLSSGEIHLEYQLPESYCYFDRDSNDDKTYEHNFCNLKLDTVYS